MIQFFNLKGTNDLKHSQESLQSSSSEELNRLESLDDLDDDYNSLELNSKMMAIWDLIKKNKNNKN